MANYNINDNEKDLDEIFARFHEEKEKKQVQNPFKFLDPYQKEDRNIFFGREQEVEEIYRKF